ncbi:MAG: hypothetical protein GY950_16095 [bacterium]|nr:hypothetical protein [bacterium]
MNIIKNMRTGKKIAAVLPVILIGLLLLVNTGCQKAEYNITGNWRVDFTLDGSGSFIVAFSGTKTIGSVIWENQQSGEYNVADKTVDFVLRLNLVVSGASQVIVYLFTGNFQDENSMGGNVTAYMPDIQGSEVNGTWTAQRL